jgi:hypothetical protein
MTPVDDERREERTRQAPPPVPSRVAAVLALQRAGGNRAVTRMLQRKVGFEFEADMWWSWKRTQPYSDLERIQPPGTRRIPAAKYEPLKKKDPIHDGVGYTLEADESKNTDGQGRQRADVEFVTEPFEETPEGLQALAATLKSIERTAGAMTGMRGANDLSGDFNWYEDLTAAGLQPRPGVLISGGDRPMRIKMQTTFGVRLDRVMELMAALGSAQPGESGRKGRARREGRELMKRHPIAGAMGQEGGGMQMMGLAAAEANRAVDAFVTRHRQPGPQYESIAAGMRNTDALKGLVSMATLYLKMGDQYAAGASYPKAIAALMARTDFAALFMMLPQDQRILFRKDDSRLWLELMQDASGLAQLDQPVLRGAEWIQQLTRELWLSHIPLGIDLLTAQGYQMLAAGMRGQGQIDDDELGEMVDDSEMLESMGSMGAKTEGAGETKAAIFELRAIPDMFPYTDIPRISNALAKYIAGLNKGKNVNFKK